MTRSWKRRRQRNEARTGASTPPDHRSDMASVTQTSAPSRGPRASGRRWCRPWVQPLERVDDEGDLHGGHRRASRAGHRQGRGVWPRCRRATSPAIAGRRRWRARGHSNMSSACHEAPGPRGRRGRSAPGLDESRGFAGDLDRALAGLHVGAQDGDRAPAPPIPAGSCGRGTGSRDSRAAGPAETRSRDDARHRRVGPCARRSSSPELPTERKRGVVANAAMASLRAERERRVGLGRSPIVELGAVEARAARVDVEPDCRPVVRRRRAPKGRRQGRPDHVRGEPLPATRAPRQQIDADLEGRGRRIIRRPAGPMASKCC